MVNLGFRLLQDASTLAGTETIHGMQTWAMSVYKQVRHMMSRLSVITFPSSSIAGSKPLGTSWRNSLGLSPHLAWAFIVGHIFELP